MDTLITTDELARVLDDPDVRVYDAKQTRTRSMAVAPGRTSQLARED